MSIIARCHFHPIDEIGLGGLHTKAVVKDRPVAQVQNNLRELAWDEAVFPESSGEPNGLGRRRYLRPDLEGKLLAEVIDDAKVGELIFRVRENFPVERYVIERVRAPRFHGARVAPSAPGGRKIG